VRAVRDFRRPILFVGLCALGSGLVVAGLTAFFRWSSGDLYPVSDQAILEIYTLHAVRGFWTLGPYSQFGWHHPGPLYFYLLRIFRLLFGDSEVQSHRSQRCSFFLLRINSHINAGKFDEFVPHFRLHYFRKLLL